VKPAPDPNGAPRYRGLIVAGVMVVAVIATGLLAGRTGSNKGGAGKPRVAFGAQILPPRSSGKYLELTNAWLAAIRDEAIGVFAGGQPGQRQNGVLVIRHGGPNVPGGPRRRIIVVHGTGALTLLRPVTPATMDAALAATVHFITANGATGSLDLSNDKVTLSG